MPRTDVVFFQESDRLVPLVEWLDGLQLKAREKCVVRLERLAAVGHELRRPEAEHLGDGFYELRVKHHRMNFRMLYFFHGNAAVVVTHGFAKQQATVPVGELRLAAARRRAFEAAPEAHSFRGGN